MLVRPPVEERWLTLAVLMGIGFLVYVVVERPSLSSGKRLYGDIAVGLFYMGLILAGFLRAWTSDGPLYWVGAFATTIGVMMIFGAGIALAFNGIARAATYYSLKDPQQEGPTKENHLPRDGQDRNSDTPKGL